MRNSALLVMALVASGCLRGGFAADGNLGERRGSALDVDSTPRDGAPRPEAGASSTLVWHAFFGGTGIDYCNTVQGDGKGNVFAGGMSTTPWGNPRRAFSVGNWDAYVVKFDGSGALLWNTFFGAEDWRGDHCSAIAVDSNGDPFVVGTSAGSWDTPRRAFAGGASDAFVAKLDGAGDLVWHTFVGGPGEDLGGGAAVVDSNGNCLLIGTSDAGWGTPRRAFAGETDGFVAKLSASGTLLWNTFLGSGGQDGAASIALDASGGVYVIGTSGASWGAPSLGHSGALDAYVARLDATGALVWNLFLGSAHDDEGRTIAADQQGLVVGGLSGANWASPKRAHQGQEDGFVAGLSLDGALLWNTFLGGTGMDVVDGVAVTGTVGVYAVGFSRSSWATPARAYSGGLSDAYAAQLDRDGALVWNLFLGGPGEQDADDDYGNSLAVDSRGSIFVGGDSSATWGAPSRAYVGDHDAYVAKLR